MIMRWPSRISTRRRTHQDHPAPKSQTRTVVLGEYILDWDDVRKAEDPHATALEFARSAFRHACAVCGWDSWLAATADGTPPPVR